MAKISGFTKQLGVLSEYVYAPESRAVMTMASIPPTLPTWNHTICGQKLSNGLSKDEQTHLNEDLEKLIALLRTPMKMGEQRETPLLAALMLGCIGLATESVLAKRIRRGIKEPCTSHKGNAVIDQIGKKG